MLIVAGIAIGIVVGVAAAVVGARDAAQLGASMAAESVTLPAEIRAALNDVSGDR